MISKEKHWPVISVMPDVEGDPWPPPSKTDEQPTKDDPEINNNEVIYD